MPIEGNEIGSRHGIVAARHEDIAARPIAAQSLGFPSEIHKHSYWKW
jgi:hypothetical protein